jgi:hypothetical protein
MKFESKITAIRLYLLENRIPKETLLLFTPFYSEQGKKLTQNYTCLNGEFCINLSIFESAHPSSHPFIYSCCSHLEHRAS